MKSIRIIKLVIDDENREKPYECVAEFCSHDEVFYVYQGVFGKVKIVSTRVHSITYTNIWNYNLSYRNHISSGCNLFLKEEEAWDYALKLKAKKGIKRVYG